MDIKSKPSRRLPSTLTARFEAKTQPTETPKLDGEIEQKRATNGIPSNVPEDRLRAGTAERREATQRQTVETVSNINGNITSDTLNGSEPLKTIKRNDDSAAQNENARESSAPTTWGETDMTSSRKEVVPETEVKPETGTEDFSSTWTDPELSITLERGALSSSEVFPNDTLDFSKNIVSPSTSCIFPDVVPTFLAETSAQSNAREDLNPNEVSEEESTGSPSTFEPSTWVDTNADSSYFEAEHPSDSLPTLEESADSFTSTWTEHSDTETGLPVGAEQDTTSSDMDMEEHLDDIEDALAETEWHSEGDTGLGSFESTPEKANAGPEEEGEEGHSDGRTDYEEIAHFNVDEINGETSDEEFPSLQDIYQRCQTIRRKRFYDDMYNAWQQKVQDDAKEDAIKILTCCGFCPADADEVGEEIDAGLRLVPDRFWQQESKADEISVEDLKAILEEKKDAESRKQFQEYCVTAERDQQRSTRRRAIVVGGGASTALLFNYLQMNLLKHSVPKYYFPSYLSRYQASVRRPDEERSDESDSS